MMAGNNMKSKPDPKPKLTDAERHKRFVEVAREVGADETEEGAERALRKVIGEDQSPKKG
jgi:hypothetical protein